MQVFFVFLLADKTLRMIRLYILLIILTTTSTHFVYSQHRGVTRNTDYTSLYLLNADKNRGFEISLSGVMMFTLGAADRNGLRWGAGLTVSKTFGDFKISSGIDAYKAKQNFGIGTTFAGVRYNDGKFGGSYYVNKYHQGDKQVSGIVNLELRDFEIRFEDDILALPFTGFVIYDRFRTAGLEIRYRHFLIGTNIYSTEPNGLTDISEGNKKGFYKTGVQVSSPVYVGYTNKSLIVRYGLNSSLGGYVGQNWWHRHFFDTSDFKYGLFKQQFLQLGVDKPYTLY